MSNPATQHSTRESTPQASNTTTITGSTSGEQQDSLVRIRLRGQADAEEEQRPQRRIRWAEGVVNNEGMGKKSSKVCCIYHKPREVGESSSEESSDSSSSDSDSSDNNGGAARPLRQHDSCDHDHDDAGGTKRTAKKARKPGSNAYEKQPRSTTVKTKSGP